MRANRFISPVLQILLALSLCATLAIAQSKVTSPKEQFGFNIGDDYQLANYTQLVVGSPGTELEFAL